jgi:hypothetical protein
VKIFHKYNLKYSEVAQSVAVGWKTRFDSQQDGYFLCHRSQTGYGTPVAFTPLVPGDLSLVLSGGSIKLTSHLHLLLGLRMLGVYLYTSAFHDSMVLQY